MERPQVSRESGNVIEQWSAPEFLVGIVTRGHLSMKLRQDWEGVALSWPLFVFTTVA